MVRKIFLLLFVFIIFFTQIGCEKTYKNYYKSAELIEISKNDNKYDLEILVKEKKNNDDELNRTIISTSAQSIKQCINDINFSESEDIILSSAYFIILKDIQDKKIIKEICKELAEIKGISPKIFIYYSNNSLINEDTKDIILERLKDIQNKNFKSGNELYQVSANSITSSLPIAIPELRLINKVYCKDMVLIDKNLKRIDINDFKIIFQRYYDFIPYSILIDDIKIDIKNIIIKDNIKDKNKIIVSPIAYISETINYEKLVQVKKYFSEYLSDIFKEYIDKSREVIMYNFIKTFDNKEYLEKMVNNKDINIVINTDFVTA